MINGNTIIKGDSPITIDDREILVEYWKITLNGEWKNIKDCIELPILEFELQIAELKEYRYFEKWIQDLVSAEIPPTPIPYRSIKLDCGRLVDCYPISMNDSVIVMHVRNFFPQGVKK